MKNKIFKFGLISVLVLSLAGCTVIFQRGRRSDIEKINELSAKLEELNGRLGQEIQDKQVKLQMMDKGLVITVVGDLVFDSGKAQIRNEAYPILEKVASILKENVAQYNIGIEGHTDNQNIRYSGWKSNWELSSARALSVLHYLVNEKGLSPQRLSAIGYGEYRPVDSNETAQGRQSNRRVEIVIFPQLSKSKATGSYNQESNLAEPAENLK
jgi:chemotaxis protein MotB